jgi:hypothetical protein
MPSLQEKLAALLRNIKRNSYDTNALADMLKLQQTIAKDINCDDPVEAMALLGYLLKYNLVIIDSVKGIILNPSKDQDINLLTRE